MSINIVKTDFSTDATLPAPPESGGWLRQLVRRVLRKLGLMAAAPAGYSLFQRNMGAYRFEADDGKICIVPVTMELVNDGAVDAEAMAREMALEQLARP